MARLFGITKIILSVLCVILSVFLFGGYHQWSNALGLFATALYAICLFYSGQTQLRSAPIKMPYLIWVEVIYGFVCLIAFAFQPIYLANTLFMGLVVLAISIDDLFRVLKRGKEKQIKSNPH